MTEKTCFPGIAVSLTPKSRITYNDVTGPISCKKIPGRNGGGMTLEVGAVFEGVVTGVTNFGAFVSLPNGKTGLVHISEIADAFVKDINEYVKNTTRLE